MEQGRKEGDQPQPVEDQPVETAAEIAATALSAVPVVGGTLSEIATAIIRRRQNRRLNQFLIDLGNDMRRLCDRVNTDFIQRAEFSDLAEDILTKAAETRQQAKLDALRSIFLNTILSCNRTTVRLRRLRPSWRAFRSAISSSSAFSPILSGQMRS